MCIYESWDLATALREAKPRFDAAGVKLVAVGVGTPDKARILATRVIFYSACFLGMHTVSQYPMVTFFFGCVCYAYIHKIDKKR